MIERESKSEAGSVTTYNITNRILLSTHTYTRGYIVTTYIFSITERVKTLRFITKMTMFINLL